VECGKGWIPAFAGMTYKSLSRQKGECAMSEDILNFINGEFVAYASGKKFEKRIRSVRPTTDAICSFI
jgi:hypothetical protein